MVWEENTDVHDKKITHITYQMSDEQKVKKETLTPANSNAFVPVVTEVEDGFLIAFLMENKNKVGAYTTRVKH